MYYYYSPELIWVQDMCKNLSEWRRKRKRQPHFPVFIVMKGEYDALLEWPFSCKINLKLFAQEGSTSLRSHCIQL